MDERARKSCQTDVTDDERLPEAVAGPHFLAFARLPLHCLVIVVAHSPYRAPVCYTSTRHLARWSPSEHAGDGS